MIKYFCSLLFLLGSCAQLVGHGADTVKTGAYIISVHDINFHDKEYTIRFWLWFLYDNKDFDFKNQLDIPNATQPSWNRTRNPKSFLTDQADAM